MSKKLDEYTKDELLAYVRQLQKDTKFGLVWNPKQENIVAECETKVPVLQEVADKAIAKAGDDEPTHLLLEGDNYHSLSVLNYTHAGKIDVIYIDPPYNTGSRDFIYNDRYVDRDDPYRHSQWLSFMDNRLRLAKNLLSDTGVIYMSIDDNEHAHLKILADSIFGEDTFLGTLTWEKRTKSQNTKTAKKMLQAKTEYVLAYKKRPGRHEFNLESTGVKSYPEDDDNGVFRYKVVEEMSSKGMRGRETMIFPILGIMPRGGYQWKLGVDYINTFLERNDVVLRDGRPYLKIRPDDEDSGTFRPFWSHFLDKDVYGTAETGKAELKAIFDGDDKGFETVKPVNLIQKILFHTTSKSAVILDFFAGSGTTGHAVLKMNDEDGGKRQFILGTNNENGIAENITFQRIDRVISGYSSVAGIPANLRYYKTDFVEVEGLSRLTDNDKLEITKEMGAMIALRENSFEQVEQTSHWQTYENATQLTAIYYREDKTKIDEYIDKLNAQDKPVKLYVFGWGKNAGTEYSSDKISVEDIPEPLIEVYKEIAR